ncbi:MAG: rhodanese-like domain-containing protein [Bacteroidetes bacterium]|nr:rhodanese-like domain-containing protein [Bacteroidota bacterium]
MKNLQIIIFILVAFLSGNSVSFSQNKQDTKQYVCFPCGGGCDNTVYDSEGKCPVCGMPLIEKSRVKFKEISPSGLLSKLHNEKGFVLLDVRTAAEFSGKGKGMRYLNGYKHLINSLNISSDELEKRIGELSQYKDSEVIVYCSHSRRSPYSCQILTDAGFTNVTNLSGGITEFMNEFLINSNEGKSFLIK